LGQKRRFVCLFRSPHCLMGRCCVPEQQDTFPASGHVLFLASARCADECASLDAEMDPPRCSNRTKPISGTTPPKSTELLPKPPSRYVACDASERVPYAVVRWRKALLSEKGLYCLRQARHRGVGSLAWFQCIADDPSNGMGKRVWPKSDSWGTTDRLVVTWMQI